MPPAAVGVLPHHLAALGVEGVERSRHGVIGVRRVGLRLGQEHDAAVIHHHRQAKLEDPGETDSPVRLL